MRQSSSFPLPSIAFSIFLLVTAALPVSSAEQAAEENYRWDEAAKFVDTLPFKPHVIDSLKKVFNVTFPSAPLRIERDRGFFCSETLVYDIGWGPFKAGYVVLTASADTASRTIRLGGKGLSNGFVSTFYRMRDHVISTVDARGLYPLFFEQHLREGKRYRRDGWILFDHQNKTIHVKERRVKTIKSPAFVNDFLSVLFLARTKKIVPGDTVTLPLYADGKVHLLAIVCKARQTINLDGTKIKSLLLEPKLVGDKGAFNKKDRLEIWLSDDSAKIPVQIKSKINVGAITARLLYCNKPGFLTAGVPRTPDSVRREVGRDTARAGIITARTSDTVGSDLTKDSNIVNSGNAVKQDTTGPGCDTPAAGDTTQGGPGREKRDTVKTTIH